VRGQVNSLAHRFHHTPCFACTFNRINLNQFRAKEDLEMDSSEEKGVWKTIDNPLFVFGEQDLFAKFHYEFAMQSPPRELFHYTSAESMLAIIKSQCMFATERSFLNDPQEFQWGISAFRDRILTKIAGSYSIDFIRQVEQALESKLSDDRRLFVLSLSANPDLLSQWRAYGDDGEGFALGFDGGVLRDRAGF
jgi:hypothetical protein